MPGRARRLVILALGAGLALLVGGCSKSTPGPARTVTATVEAPPPSSPSPAPSTRARPSPRPTRIRPTTTPTPMSELRGPCDTVLPQSVLESMIGSAASGTTAFVVGLPEPSTGRVSYLNCRYGIVGGDLPPSIEIGVSLYRTVKQAEQRIPQTVEDYTTNHSATVTDIMVDGKLARLLTQGRGLGYNVPTVILSSGQRTIAVSVTDDTEPSPGSTVYLTELAYLAVTRSGG